MSEAAYSLNQSGFQFRNPGEVLSPYETNTYLQLLTNAIGRAQLDLRKARRVEVDAEEAYHRAKAPYLDDAPEVGSHVSQKARDAWFADRVPDQFLALRRASAARNAAWDFLEALKEQAMLMGSLNKTALAIETITTRAGGA
ncbi:hypothetical protein GT755_12220 [Herbidospora sp. NEAU-GS84]|uniref:Uncharacterized protein n=1 Tax=Herbidospora solisilvae TaxID=2696284 RepID=A0A7C9J255_9ACTN|nr:hypothetical protein [Herbidospora solisilvae]NAS22447.1 hypothetical protein [Herbidospora solisilvae]